MSFACLVGFVLFKAKFRFAPLVGFPLLSRSLTSCFPFSLISLTRDEFRLADGFPGISFDGLIHIRRSGPLLRREPG